MSWQDMIFNFPLLWNFSYLIEVHDTELWVKRLNSDRVIDVDVSLKMNGLTSCLYFVYLFKIQLLHFS